MRIQSNAERARQQAGVDTNTAAIWHREANQWFDGTLSSVDRRLAMCNTLLAHSREAVGKEGASRQHLAAISDLQVAQSHLQGLREDLLTASQNKESAEHRVEDFRGPITPGDDAGIARNPYTGDTETGRFNGDPEGHGHWDQNDRTHFLSHTDKRYVALEGASFYRANVDVDRDELLIRAQNHAEVQTSTLPVSRSKDITAAFVQKVAQLYRPAPRVASAPRRVPDGPDELIFM